MAPAVKQLGGWPRISFTLEMVTHGQNKAVQLQRSRGWGWNQGQGWLE